MARSPLSQSLKRVQDLMHQYATLSTDEQGLFLDMLLPEPEPDEQPKQRKTRKKRTAAATPAAGRKKGLPQQQALTSDNPIDDDEGPMCQDCPQGEFGQNHTGPGPNAHPFNPVKAAKAGA